MSDISLLEPRLGRFPDARRATLRLLEPSLLPYVALMFGSALAALLACFNALALRRFGSAAASLAVGLIGWASFGVVVTAGARMHIGHIALALLVGRAVHFLLGSVLYFMQRPHLLGHAFLGGRMVPLRVSYLTAFLLAIYLPGSIMLALLGAPYVG